MEPDRWERLADSLWADSDEGVDDALVRAVAEAESAQVRLVDRLRVSGRVIVHGVDQRLSGEIDQVGPDAFVICTDEWRWIVPLRAVTAIEGLGAALASREEKSTDRLGLGSMLRAASGPDLQMRLVGGHIVEGRIAMVGADHVDVHLAESETVLTIGWSAITSVRIARG